MQKSIISDLVFEDKHKISVFAIVSLQNPALFSAFRYYQLPAVNGDMPNELHWVIDAMLEQGCSST